MSPANASKVIRAIYDDRTIRVYQAYGWEIAVPALKAGRFVAPFKMGRMTWIKPSFNWMMYRSGYGSKPGQEFVLGIDITREGFEWAVAHAARSTFVPGIHASEEVWKRELAASPVRVQWDPERDWRLAQIPDVRSIQIGLSGEAVKLYVENWIIRIEDVTPVAVRAATAAQAGVPAMDLPCFQEKEYPSFEKSL